jgi:hypothetical protein
MAKGKSKSKSRSVEVDERGVKEKSAQDEGEEVDEEDGDEDDEGGDEYEVEAIIDHRTVNVCPNILTSEGTPS